MNRTRRVELHARRRRSCLLVMLACFMATRVFAHDFERTHVSLTFGRDGSFVLDVTYDLSWLAARLPQFAAGERNLAALGSVFRDRVVLFVDGHEVRPDSAEFVPPAPPSSTPDAPVLATYRLRGRIAADARTLRWYYGLVVDPYQLTLRRADGHVLTETVYGDAWSRALEVGLLEPPRPIRTAIARQLPVMTLVVIMALALALRTTKITKPTKQEI